MRHYDIIIIGAGISGLTLAYYLDKIYNSRFSICVLERKQNHFPKYISFWGTSYSETPTIIKSWDSINIISPVATKSFPLRNNHFHLLRSDKYLEYIQKMLSPKVTLIYENVLKAEQTNNSCDVITDVNTYTSDIVFDNRFELRSIDSTHFMSGAGIHITTDKPHFCEDEVTLIDSRASKSSLFFYVLPLSKTEAIIESAEISLGYPTIDATILKSQLKEYIENTLKIKRYNEKSYEYGIIPLIDAPQKRRISSRVIKIGTSAGLVNPMTSFGFANILNDSRIIAETISIEFPKRIKYFSKGSFYKIINQMTSHLLHKDKTLQPMLFNSIIKSKDGDSILNFLCESQNPLECLAYMISIGDIQLVKRLASVLLH